MTLAAGVIDLFSVPPPDQLLQSTTSPVVLSNPYSGSASEFTGSGGVNAFGLHWAVSTSPSGAGRSVRSVTVFEQQFLSFSLHYTLADASDVVGDSYLTGAAEGFYLFAIARPVSIQFNVLPGFTVTFAWLVAP
jgi:hypothetical protein